MKKMRYEFFILTITIFGVGVVLYGLVGIGLAISNINVWNLHDIVLSCIFTSLGGGYFFFSILSGVLFTAKWLSQKSFRGKVVLTIFFIVPLWLAMAGIFYSIPYGIYNFVQYKKFCGEIE